MTTPELLVSLSLFAPATAVSEPLPPSPRLTVVWADPDRLLRYGFEPMAEEVGRIFGDAGIEIEWRKSVRGLDASQSTTVIVHLTDSSSETWRPHHQTMGLMVPLDRPGLNRVVRVFLAEILGTLDLDVEKTELPRARETMILARALARVVAHEIVHAVAPDADHTAAGLMKPELTRADLEMNRLSLSRETADALRRGLQRDEP